MALGCIIRHTHAFPSRRSLLSMRVGPHPHALQLRRSGPIPKRF